VKYDNLNVFAFWGNLGEMTSFRSTLRTPFPIAIAKWDIAIVRAVGCDDIARMNF
jgi:hypothetical protein